MIPQRRLSRSSVGNGVSCRREACRRRLRLVRTNGAPARLDISAAEVLFDSAGMNSEATATAVDGLETKGRDEAEIT